MFKYNRQRPSHAKPENERKPRPKNQTEEAKRKISLTHLAAGNPRWAGDHPKNPKKTGHQRAKRLFGNRKGLEKHHIDGNPLNNNPSNILWVTRKEHMELDGRLSNLINGHLGGVKNSI
jgi:hypothetical protein